MTYNLTHYEVTDTLEIKIKARNKDSEEKEFVFPITGTPLCVLDDDLSAKEYFQKKINKK